jgi:hypothetical protein
MAELSFNPRKLNRTLQLDAAQRELVSGWSFKLNNVLIATQFGDDECAVTIDRWKIDILFAHACMSPFAALASANSLALTLSLRSRIKNK